MKNYKEINAKSYILDSIICDKCKKEYKVKEDEFEIQEFHHIKFTGGYGSVFGDMTKVECDICQYCLKDMIGTFATYKDWYGELL